MLSQFKVPTTSVFFVRFWFLSSHHLFVCSSWCDYLTRICILHVQDFLHLRGKGLHGQGNIPRLRVRDIQSEKVFGYYELTFEMFLQLLLQMV